MSVSTNPTPGDRRDSGARVAEPTHARGADAAYETGGRTTTLDRDVRPEPHSAIAVDGGQTREDGVRWGAVWAGLIVALGVFLILELVFFALGWLNLDPGVNQSGSTAGLVTGILALIAFFIGGLTAGKTALWRDRANGLLHGVLVWALGVVSIILFTLLGGGALLGSFSQFITQFVSLRNPSISGAEVQQAVESTRTAAGYAAFGLGLSVIASAIGGVIGGKMRPGHDDRDARATVR